MDAETSSADDQVMAALHPNLILGTPVAKHIPRKKKPGPDEPALAREENGVAFSSYLFRGVRIADWMPNPD